MYLLLMNLSTSLPVTFKSTVWQLFLESSGDQTSNFRNSQVHNLRKLLRLSEYQGNPEHNGFWSIVWPENSKCAARHGDGGGKLNFIYWFELTRQLNCKLLVSLFSFSPHCSWFYNWLLSWWIPNGLSKEREAVSFCIHHLDWLQASGRLWSNLKPERIPVTSTVRKHSLFT